MPSVVDHRSLLRNTAGVGLIAVLLTLMLAWPVIRQPDELLYGSEIVGRHSDAYTVIRGFSDPQPLGGTTQAGVDWVGAWLARWIGPVAAYNLLVLVTFPLTATVTFALALYLGLGRWPALWVALLYAFSPLHIAHAAYHPHVAQLHWIPLALLAMIAATDRWTPRRGLLLVVVLIAAGLSNFYAALMLAALTPPMMWALKFNPVRSGRGWKATAWTLGAAGVAAVFYIAAFHGGVILDPLRQAFPAADAQRYAARWFAYLTPPVEHPLTGTLGRTVWAWLPPGDALVEQQVYLGWAPLLLAIAGIACWRRQPATRLWRAAPAVLVLTCLALLLSLAPVWRLGFLALPAPSWILRAVAPMFRAYARFGFLVQLGVLLLAGLAWTHWRAGGRKSRHMILGGLVALSVVEFAPFPPWRSHPLYPHAGYPVLQSLEPGWAALDCTLGPEVIPSVAMLVPGSVYAAERDLRDCAEPDLASKLAAQGITHVMDRAGGPLQQRPGFTPAAQREGMTVYQVDSPPAELYVRRWSGFSWREGEGQTSIRWAGGQSALWLEDPLRKPRTVTLEIELVAFPEPRQVSMVLNGEEIAQLAVPAERAWFALEIPLGPARNRLQLVAEGVPVTPDSVLGNGDRRLLALAVGGVRYPFASEVPLKTDLPNTSVPQPSDDTAGARTP